MGFYLDCYTEKHYWSTNKFYGYTNDSPVDFLSYNYLKQIGKLPKQEYKYIKESDDFHFWDLGNCGVSFKTILQPEEFVEFVRLYFIDQLQHRTKYTHFKGEPPCLERFDGFNVTPTLNGKIPIAELVEIFKEEKPVTLEWS